MHYRVWELLMCHKSCCCSEWLQWSCGFSDLVSWSDLHIRSSSTSTTREVTLGMPRLCNPKVLCAAFWPQPPVLLALPVSSTHYQFCQFPFLLHSPLQAGPYCMPFEVLTLRPRHFEESRPWLVAASSFSTRFGWQNAIPGNRVTAQTWCSVTLWVKPSWYCPHPLLANLFSWLIFLRSICHYLMILLIFNIYLFIGCLPPQDGKLHEGRRLFSVLCTVYP